MIYLSLFVAVLCGFALGYIYRWRGLPFLGKWKTPFIRIRKEFSIGISRGTELDGLQSDCTIVLSRHDVSDVTASFVADPFLLQKDGSWYMFMEVFNKSRNRGEIGLATSDNGLEWKYQSIILNELFHMSYPYVFEYQKKIWMIPESRADNSVRLYRAVDFPRKWILEKKLLEGKPYTDPSIFQHKGLFWMFVSCNNSRDLMLYFSNDLTGPWKKHPRSPIVYFEPKKARCAGRVVTLDGKIIRFAQDCEKEYGTAVHAYCIEYMDTNKYKENKLMNAPILFGSGKSWNKNFMHHIDLHFLPDNSYLAAVDGARWVRDFGLKY